MEIDGIQHTWADQVVGDALRQNEVTLSDAVVLRVPLLGLRVTPDPFFDQIITALKHAGCPFSRAGRGRSSMARRRWKRRACGTTRA